MVRPPKFHTRPRRKPPRQARRSAWRRIAPFLILLLVIGVAAYIMRLPVVGGEWERVDTHFTLCGTRSSHGCVIDGDTIVLGKRKIRLVGYNAPEIEGDCAAERALARRSQLALQDWLNEGPFTMDGGAEPPFDQYGRELRRFKRGDEWLSETMIDASLAQDSGWGFARAGWCD